jgi:hypothetical protein
MPARKHHFVPVFYQKGFADRDGLLWVYDRKLRTFKRLHPSISFDMMSRNLIGHQVCQAFIESVPVSKQTRAEQYFLQICLFSMINASVTRRAKILAA